MRVAATIALFFALTVPAHAAKRTVPRGWLGVVVDGPMTNPAFPSAPEWDQLAGSGAEAVRGAVSWRLLQPSGPADADFTSTDSLVQAAAQRGLGVLPVIQDTPVWASQNPGDPASPPRNPADFARVLTALVVRYGPNGAFWAAHPELPRLPIRSWQIWNEPNLTRYWNVAPWAPPYVKLVKAADAALHKADPGAQTVLAGLPNESWNALEAIYDAGGRGSFDVVTLHPYTGKPVNVIRILKIVRRVMRKHHDSKLPLWVTELSWPAGLGHTKQEGDFSTTDDGQAQRLKQGLQLLADQRKTLGIGRVYWYTWLSQEGITASAFDYSGLRRLHDGQLRTAPALAVFEQAARTLEGCTKRARQRACLCLIGIRFQLRAAGRGLSVGPGRTAAPAPAARRPGRAARVLDAPARLRALRRRRDRLDGECRGAGRGLHARQRARAAARADRRPLRLERANRVRRRLRGGHRRARAGRGAGRADAGARRRERRGGAGHAAARRLRARGARARITRS